MKAFTLLHPLVALVDMQLIGVYAVLTLDLGKGSGPCDFGASKSSTTRQQEPACGATDGYVGSDVIYEDAYARIWNFTLAPGQSTSMHRHDHDYDFVAISPTQLEVYGEDGSRLFDFRAEGTLGFKVKGDFLDPIDIELPPVPRVHAAKNIGNEMYHEILYESKT